MSEQYISKEKLEKWILDNKRSEYDMDAEDYYYTVDAGDLLEAMGDGRLSAPQMVGGELLPCPFCGGQAETKFENVFECGIFYCVECRMCGSRTDTNTEIEALAIKAWNTRPTATQGELVDKLKAIEFCLTPDNPSGAVLPENISRARVLAKAALSASPVAAEVVEPKICDRVRATMNDIDWVSGVYEQSVDVFASYGVRCDDTGELAFFIHAELTPQPTTAEEGD